MKRFFLLLLILNLPLLAAGQNVAASHDQEGARAFVAAHVDRAAAPPFSFTYNGRVSSRLLPNWKVSATAQEAGDRTVRTIVYADSATGLRVTAIVTIFHDYPAVEWVLRFKNEGASDTPILEDVQACAVRFDDWPQGPMTLFRAKGSNAEKDDFAPIQDALTEKAEVRFGPTAGRSSDTEALPFFNIAASGRGVVAAVGWSGKWLASVKRPGPRSLELQAGMTRTRFKLRPEEEVRSPSIALLFWKSADRMAGHNLFRRFVLAHHTPLIQGRPVSLPLAAGIGFGGPFPCNEYVCATESYALAMIDRLKQFGIDPEDCWIDAGWYENATRFWWSGVGTWSVNRANFPRGLKPVTEAARKWGKGFVLWFEPERVYQGTQLDREHPDWLTFLPGNANRLLNLGNPRALSWLIDHISNFIQSEGVTIYRQDFNFDPAPYWKSMDAPDRVGIAEMKHIEGLYAFWDALLARNPGLLIDNCASGGRRIDLETIGRSVPLWRTDYQYFEPNGYQCHTYGLHFFLPCTGTGNGSPQKYQFRSSMGGAVVVGWEMNAAFNAAQAVEDMAEYRALRPYFSGDYYPLTEYSTSDESWSAMQWDRPDEHDGIVLAFRRPQALASSIIIKVQAAAPDRDYEVSFEDYGISLIKSGKELAAGLTFKIPEAPGSLLLKYRIVR